MATARPPSGGQSGGTPTARMGIDLSQMQRAPQVAREAGRATARELSQAFRALQAEQRVALEQQRQTTAVVRAQQAQITATARAESAQRMAQARTEAQAEQQAARMAAATKIEEERRVTAQHRSELRMREAEQRAALRASQAAQRSTFAAGGFGQLAGAFGVGFGAAQIARAAVEGDRLATAYERQYRAAARLAGGQQQLNELLEAYDRATGGVVNQATALQQVLALQSTGFAKNAAELERFALATRGAAMATGRAQDQVAFFTQLEILNATNQRLNEIGLGTAEVNQRQEELRRTTQGLNDQQIRTEAILGLLIEKYGDLAKEPPTAVENLRKTWDNQTLAIGRATGGLVDFMATGIDSWLQTTQRDIEFVQNAWQKLNDTIRNTGPLLRDAAAGGGPALPGAWRGGSWAGGGVAGGGGGGGGTGGFGGETAPGFTLEQQQAQDAAILGRFLSLNQIARDAARQISETTRQAEEQRSKVIADYERSRVREAEDFGRQRANAERKFNFDILKVHEDSARQRAKWAADLERNIGQARADSAERVADMEADHARDLAQKRADSAEKVAEWEADRAERMADRRRYSTRRLEELEADYQRSRERTLVENQERLNNAAARFDAITIYREQRRQQLEAAEAQRAHAEQLEQERAALREGLGEIDASHRARLDDERRALDKSVRQAQDSHNRRLQDEAAALEKRTTQLQEAHARQLEEQQAADALRLEEMRRDFDERTRQEDTERGIRLARMAEDHNDQLDEMARQQAQRIQQIQDHAQEERDEINRQHQERLAATGLQTAAWEREQELLVNRAIASHKRFWEEINQPRLGPTGTPAGWPSLSEPFQHVPPVPTVGGTTNNNTTFSVAPGAIVVTAAPGQSPYDIAAEVTRQFETLLRNSMPGGHFR